MTDPGGAHRPSPGPPVGVGAVPEGYAVREGHRRGERGSATVLAAGLIGVLLSLGLAALLLASAVIASHRARAAADLAALAAAGAVLRGQSSGVACEAAAAVARANSARLDVCAPDGSSVRVTVTVRPAVGRLGDATARARAGPPPAGAAVVTTTRLPS